MVAEGSGGEVLIDPYTEARRKVLGNLLISLVKKGLLKNENLGNVVDLGCYQGSSSVALRDVGAQRVLSVDRNLDALEVGRGGGSITDHFESDIVDFVTQELSLQYRGLVTAFNCLLYLSDDEIGRLFLNLDNKMGPGSQFIFSFSEKQRRWVNRFRDLIDRGHWLPPQMSMGEPGDRLDRFIFILTKPGLPS